MNPNHPRQRPTRCPMCGSPIRPDRPPPKPSARSEAERVFARKQIVDADSGSNEWGAP